MPITEQADKVPVNAYGETKLAFERALAWYRRSFGVCHVSFRYFNACGATEKRGEDRSKETHLIPILFPGCHGEKRESLTLYGSGLSDPGRNLYQGLRSRVRYRGGPPARIGKCRSRDPGSDAFNLGSGKGHSNREVIEATRRVTGHGIPIVEGERRAGDPAVLVASFEHAKKVLGWQPRYTDLGRMIESAWSWRDRHPQGYSK